MSSFVVDNTVISNILNALEHTCKYDRMEGLPNPKYGSEMLVVMNEEQCQRLGQELHDMNIDAVGQRYPDTVGNGGMPGTMGDDGELDTFVFVPSYNFDPFQVLKSIHCLLYQCSEGDVDTRDLFKQLERWGFNIARSIVMDMPEYERSNWG